MRSGSGLIVLRTAPIEPPEIAALARDVAERYGGSAGTRGDAVVCEFRGAATLALQPAGIEAVAAAGSAALLARPVAGVLRLHVTARSNRLEAALDAERALVLAAALLAGQSEAIAVDDAGAVFGPDELYELATRNAMRADACGFVAAVARSAWPAPPAWFSERGGVCDELVVFSSRPWRADFAASFLGPELAALAEAASYTGDPVVPASGTMVAAPDRGAPEGPQRLAVLDYETVQIEVSYLDAARAAGESRARVQTRRDVAALLGRPIAGAIVIAFGNRGADTESERFTNDMRRAETLATALAASFAQRGDCVTSDVMGTLYGTEELVRLALRRCGKSLSWNARVARSTADAA